MRQTLTKDIRQELAGRQKGRCAQCGDQAVQEVDHAIPRGARCHGVESIENYAYLCAVCHKAKAQQDHLRMNVEDPNVYVSRFNQEAWEGFVMAIKPTQVV